LRDHFARLHRTIGQRPDRSLESNWEKFLPPEKNFFAQFCLEMMVALPVGSQEEWLEHSSSEATHRNRERLTSHFLIEIEVDPYIAISANRK
jgi:2-methylcitrate dehydratase PrpD